MQFSVRMLPAKFPYRWAHSCTVCIALSYALVACARNSIFHPNKFDLKMHSIGNNAVLNSFWFLGFGQQRTQSCIRNWCTRERERDTHLIRTATPSLLLTLFACFDSIYLFVTDACECNLLTSRCAQPNVNSFPNEHLMEAWKVYRNVCNCNEPNAAAINLPIWSRKHLCFGLLAN